MLFVPEAHVITGVHAIVPVVCFSALLLLPHDVLLVALANLLGPRLVDEVVILLHAVVHVHEALVVDEQLELLAVLGEPEAVRSNHQLILERFPKRLLGVDQAIISEQFLGTRDDRVLQVEAVAHSIQVEMP